MLPAHLICLVWFVWCDMHVGRTVQKATEGIVEMDLTEQNATARLLSGAPGHAHNSPVMRELLSG